MRPDPPIPRTIQGCTFKFPPRSTPRAGQPSKGTSQGRYKGATRPSHPKDNTRVHLQIPSKVNSPRGATFKGYVSRAVQGCDPTLPSQGQYKGAPSKGTSQGRYKGATPHPKDNTRAHLQIPSPRSTPRVGQPSKGTSQGRYKGATLPSQGQYKGAPTNSLQGQLPAWGNLQRHVSRAVQGCAPPHPKDNTRAHLQRAHLKGGTRVRPFIPRTIQQGRTSKFPQRQNSSIYGFCDPSFFTPLFFYNKNSSLLIQPFLQMLHSS